MMETIGHRLTSLSSSELALVMLALHYAVLVPAWVMAALVLPGDRRSATWWTVYAATSAVGLMLIVVGMHDQQFAARALGNVLMTVGILSLQRGLWAFTGQRAWNLPQAGVLLIATLLSTLAAIDLGWVPVRIAVVSAMWAVLYGWCALAVWRHVRHNRWQRWSPLHAAPLVLASLLLAARALRAAQAPELVTLEVEQNTLLSVGSSLTGLVASLVLQMTLVSLLVSRLVGRLEQLSRHDALTGLLNRRAMDDLLQQEEQRVRRFTGHTAGRVTLLMIDVDHFKQLNDTHGHGVGDRALQHLAAVMRTQLRDIDALARWGGEEFLALLPATEGDDAVAIAERLCDRVRNLALISEETRLVLTVSVGVADWQGQDDSMAALLKRADAALYAAKRSGRNQVQRSDLPGRGDALAA